MEDKLVPSGQVSANEFEEVVARMIEGFSTHPGFMVSEGLIEILHADWPAYPVGEGRRSLVKALAEYPDETQFHPIDNIDLCSLYVVGQRPTKDPYGPNYLHVALRDKDVQDCAGAGLVHLQDDGALTLTESGHRYALVLELTLGVREDLLAEVFEFLNGQRHDTAVREAAIRLELALRRISNLKSNGQKLVNECFGSSGCLIPPGMINSRRLMLHSMFRSYFAYVRNEYAHNIPSIDLVSACRLLRRTSHMLNLIDTLVAHSR